VIAGISHAVVLGVGGTGIQVIRDPIPVAVWTGASVEGRQAGLKWAAIRPIINTVTILVVIAGISDLIGEAAQAGVLTVGNPILVLICVRNPATANPGFPFGGILRAVVQAVRQSVPIPIGLGLGAAAVTRGGLIRIRRAEILAIRRAIIIPVQILLPAAAFSRIGFFRIERTAILSIRHSIPVSIAELRWVFRHCEKDFQQGVAISRIFINPQDHFRTGIESLADAFQQVLARFGWSAVILLALNCDEIVPGERVNQ